MEWPESFYEMRRGVNCFMCAEGRPEENPIGLRIFAGQVSDAYLRKVDIQRGLTIQIWRGPHVAEPTELDPADATAYWLEVLRVAAALETYLKPVKMNYNLLGNSGPHLHTHLVPRYADDPRPGWPFPFPEQEPPLRDEESYRSDVEALRALLA